MTVYEHSSLDVIKFLRAQRPANKTLTNWIKERLKMPTVRFTKEDLLARKQLAAGWRTLTVKSIEEEPGKTDPTSINYVCTVVVTGGPDDGVTIKNWFSEKRKDLLSKFVECFIANHSIDMGKDYDLNNTVGRQVDGYCQYDIQRQWNSVLDWRPASSKGAANVQSRA
jgi:hypothetical protein